VSRPLGDLNGRHARAKPRGHACVAKVIDPSCEW
jgi:hypothetical protein